MRRKVMISVALHTLAAVAGLLWLLWYFIPTGNVFNGLSTALIILLAGWYVFKNCRHEEPVSDANLPAAELPLLDAEGPVVLVCGDMLDALFQGSTLRKTAQGWWLRVGDVSRLTDVVRSIQTQFPHQVGQLSVMYRCLPDRHQDEAVLRSALKTLRQQCKQIKSLTGITLPAVLSAEFSGPETPWIIVRGDKPMVCPFNDSPQAFIDWQQTDDNILALPTVSQAFSFIRNTLADELEKPDGLTPPVRVFSVIMRLGVVNPETRSVWAGWLYSRTCLQFSRAPGQSSTSLFPDAVLPLLAPFASIVQGGQRKAIDLTDTRDYGSLVAASLGQEWNGFGQSLFVQPLDLAWRQVLAPAAGSLNTRWQSTIVEQWNKAFAGRYPFKATGSDASLPLLAQFLRSDSGRITTFLKTNLGGILHQEGNRWVVDPSASQGMVVSPDFLRAINQLAELSDIVFSQGDAGIHFELMARPSKDVARVQLTLDEQNLDYFNQMESWQSFTWPGNSYYPGVSLSWRSVNSGMQLYANNQGNWGFIRLLDKALLTPLDASRTQLVWITSDGNPLKFVMRSELGSGPLELLKLQGFTLPNAIFNVAAGAEAIQ
ncbi:TPA: type VI secretion IcmF C-terminal domain-containing protein [Klebsiella variicola subsp. variicola]